MRFPSEGVGLVVTEFKLFRANGSNCELLAGSSAPVEKVLQGLIERHLGTFLGVHFLASEVRTSQEYGGRIDTLGLDDSGRPVIIEYKRGLNENVINQGLYYMSWLVESKAEFETLVARRNGPETKVDVNWESPRLICMASEFTRFDLQAVYHSNRSIDLVRYRYFEGDLILLETVASSTTPASPMPMRRPATSSTRAQRTPTAQTSNSGTPPTSGTFQGHSPLDRASVELRIWFHSLREWMETLGGDVTVRITASYIAFQRTDTFAWVHCKSGQNLIEIGLPLPPDQVELVAGFAEIDRRGDLRLYIRSETDVERAKPILYMSYGIS